MCQHLSQVYPAAHQLEPTFYLCQASAGARALWSTRLVDQITPAADALIPRAIACSNGLTVTVLPYGGRIQSIKLHGQELTLSQADPAFYLTDSAALGASVGRYANRIANAALHRQPRRNVALECQSAAALPAWRRARFAQRVWTVLEHSADSLLLELVSLHGGPGFFPAL